MEQVAGIAVAGKTGTAENPHGQPHAWFIGFAPADNPVIAVAVIIENGGGGGEMAAPVARQIFSELIH
jgi:peptidoglycan glycosyltransferase